MELGKQIKKYRNEMSISQEELARFTKLGNLFSIMLVVSIITPVPLVYYGHLAGAAV